MLQGHLREPVEVQSRAPIELYLSEHHDRHISTLLMVPRKAEDYRVKATLDREQLQLVNFNLINDMMIWDVMWHYQGALADRPLQFTVTTKSGGNAEVVQPHTI